MCCCTVPSCCCGCTSMQRGLEIYAIVDAFVNLFFAILNVLIGTGAIAGFPFIMIIMDIMLAAGVHVKNDCLILVWMIFAMLYIIYGFISALILTLAVSQIWIHVETKQNLETNQKRGN